MYGNVDCAEAGTEALLKAYDFNTNIYVNKEITYWNQPNKKSRKLCSYIEETKYGKQFCPPPNHAHAEI